MKDKYTAQASTTEEAIQKGLKALGIKKENADIDVQQEAKKGFLGIGQKDALVVVKRKNAKSPIDELVSREVILGEESSSTIKPSKDEKVEEDTDDEIPVEPVAEDPDEVLEAVEEAEEESESEDEEKLTDKEEAAQETEEREKKAEKNQKDEEAIEKVMNYLERIALKMGVDDISVSVDRDDSRVHFSLETEDAGLIIGRHGKVLNSLQTLAQIQLHQEADNKLYAKVDAENYRDRRKKTVEQLATRTAEKVKRTNRPVILEPMPAHERKQIHRYLNQYKGVQTHSEGKDPHRYLVVEPSEKEEFKL